MTYLKQIGALLFVAFSVASDGAQERPNILFIMVDDLGWGDVGFHDPTIYSPNLDKLAEDGIKLTRHYVAPQCTPTRVSFLTGRYAQRFGPQAIIAGYNVQAIPYETPTLASLLQSEGYDTALIGKWHLGSVPGQHPNLWGFDYSYGVLGGAVGVYDHRYRLSRKDYADTWHRNGVLIPGAENGKPYEEGTHVTDLITQDAINFLQQKRNKPFFLYLAYTAVHTPLAEEKKWFDDPEGKIRRITGESRRLLAATVHHLDDGIGQVLKVLEVSGQRDNTIVVFTSDNGGVTSGHKGGAYPQPNPQLKKGYSSNGSLRSGKTHVYEGGIRVPTIVHWPEKLNDGVIDSPVHICDWLPTFCDIVGVSNLPENLDGKNILPVINGEAAEERLLYFARGDKIPWARRAIIKGNWKLISEKNQWELYNISEDPSEITNLSETYPERLAALTKAYEEEVAKDEGHWMPSAWIKFPDSVKAGSKFQGTVMCSVPMELQPEHFRVTGAEILSLKPKNKQRTQWELTLRANTATLTIQVRANVLSVEGRMNQPSQNYRVITR